MACVAIVGGIEIAVGIDAAHVVHGGGDGSLDARVDGRRIDRHASPTADAEDAYLFRVHVVTGGEVVHRCREVLGVDVGRSHITGLSAALAGERRVEGYREEAAFGEFLRIQPRCLLLDSPERAADGNGGQFARHALGHVEVGGKRDAVTVVERDFRVVHFVTLWEYLAPFLRKIQFFFHDVIRIKLIFLCHEAVRAAEAGEQSHAD